MARPIFRKGTSEISAPGSGKFLKLQDGDSIQITPLVGLDELLSIDQHAFWDINPAFIMPCLQVDCPACELGDKPAFKAFLPVLTKEGDVKVFSFGIKVYRQLEEIEAELGSIKGKVLKARKSGTGRTSQTNVVAIGKTIKVDDQELPDIISLLGPTDHDEVVKIMKQRGLLSDDGETEAEGEVPFDTDEPKSKKAGSKGKPASSKSSGSDDWEDL